jgi:hypothetical protein
MSHPRLTFFSLRCRCRYGLFVLFLAVRPTIQAYRPGLKLLAIKLIVIINAVQGVIVGAAVTKANGKKTDGNIFSQDYKQVFWRNWLLNVEALPLVFLLARAYPASELLLPTLRAVAEDAAADTENNTDPPDDSGMGANKSQAIPMARPADAAASLIARQPSPKFGSNAHTPLLLQTSSA